MRRAAAAAIAGVLGLGLLSVPAGTAGAAPPDPGSPTVFVGELNAQQMGALAKSGIDRRELKLGKGSNGRFRVEAVLSRGSAAQLRAQGLGLTEKRVDGDLASARMAEQNAAGFTVFRSWSEPGGIRDELDEIAATYPDLVKRVVIGRSVQGQEIVALKVTKDARSVRDGSRPATLYSSTQHAREWITPEMTRRLLRYYLENYASDDAIRRVINRTELWFVPVANPDGYDYTFTEGNRLWRKNLRDNDGDGQITGIDGVDPNRNWPYRWGYDNEGSSPTFSNPTYRGTAPASEPETRALNGLMRRVGFEFQINYHSAAELLLYGVGWQVATPTPDDLLYETLAGDDAAPAVPGYDPDIAAELYTTNGETTEHAHNVYDTLAFTPEMSTCETASAVDPEDAFEPEDCESVFNFPDSEVLVQAEFEKNIPFALAVAQSALDPDDPVSVVGRTAPNFQLDPFDTSYGDPQPVAVTARRDLRDLELHYRIDDGRKRSIGVREWRGGERYGDEGDTYYAEYRGVIRGVDPGEDVEVWFSGRRRGEGRVESDHFSYTLQTDTRDRVLVVANEDYEGVNPEDAPIGTGPKYAQGYVDAIAAAGYGSQVWDVSAQGVPHHLGVLGHFDAVVWYLGDNRLTQDPEDAEIQFGSQQVPDAAVAERQQYLTISVRDYLNEGGRLLHTGETAAYYGIVDPAYGLGGIYYGLDGAPSEECAVTADPYSDCLILSNDFTQYYLGAWSRAALQDPTGLLGTDRPLQNTEVTLGGPAVADNPLDEVGSFVATSTVLPPEDFPLFRSEISSSYTGVAGGAFDPVEGESYVGAVHTDDSYLRLTRTVDLSGVTAADTPALEFQLSHSVEPNYDFVIVEAHTPGQDNWTTLAGTGTSTAVPADCEQGFLLETHPFLEHYLTLGETACTGTGTSGAWNARTGDSGGWQQVAYDLGAFAGQEVEVSISYVTDPAFGAVGVVIDDTRVTAGGQTLDAEGFETGLGVWAPTGPPEGSPAVANAFARSQGLLGASITTRDSVLLGVGVEQITTPAERARLLRPVLRYLLR